MKTYLWLNSAGHGGMIDDKYVTAPDKMYIFPDGTTIYEGERNRLLVNFITELGDMDGLWQYDVTGNSQIDVPLPTRTKVANDLFDRYPNTIYNSFHMNAGKGIGTEIFTSPGQTASDHHAALVMDTLEEEIDDLVIRADFSDKDVDKEAKFWELVKTNCPSWLLEVGFMDDYNNAMLLLDDDYLLSVAKAVHKYRLKAELLEI